MRYTPFAHDDCNAEEVSMGFDNIVSAFAQLGIGAILALILVALERLCSKSSPDR